MILTNSMLRERIIDRAISVVDRCLRHSFPNDYDARCMYGARAIETLLVDANLNAHLCGGEIAALLIAKNRQRATFEGFGKGGRSPSHYWVLAENTLIDLGPSYLPLKSRLIAMKMPFVAWSDADNFPNFLRYKTQIKFEPSAPLAAPKEIQERMNTFIALCREKYSAQRGNSKIRNWVLRDIETIKKAADNKDPWAQEIIQNPERIARYTVPF